MLKTLLFLLTLLATAPAFAEVRVLFVEVRGYGGRQIQLEENGRFAHVAVSYRGKWLQALPANGVELVTYADIAKTGSLVMLKSTKYLEPSTEFVKSVLGNAFEMEFSWESENYYCSKLVAKTLDLVPLPMTFNTRAWHPRFQKYNGLLGLSPDDVYEQLLQLGFVHVTGKHKIPSE